MVKITGADRPGAPGRTEKPGGPQHAETGGAGKAGVAESGKVPGAKRPGPVPLSQTPVSRPPGGSPIPAGLAWSLGLPRDALSGAILSFARYFSLPLSPGLMTKIRRESLPVPEQLPQGKSAAATGRDAQAAALAAAAAASKGLELTGEALRAYAMALSGSRPPDPEFPEQGSGNSGGNSAGDGGSGGSSTGGSPTGGNPTHDDSTPANSGDSTGGNSRGGSDLPGQFSRSPVEPPGLITAESLREKVLAVEAENPLLSLLNRMPGKNGERWINLPFSFTRGDLEYRVILRVLVDGVPAPGSPGRLTLDISAGDRDNPALRWLFMYREPPGASPRLTGRFWPPQDKNALRTFKKELARLFDLHTEHIFLQNDGEFSPFAPDCRDSLLLSINEEV